MTNVVFPEPVDPMMDTVSPLLTSKEIWRRVSSAEPGYLKDTSSNLRTSASETSESPPTMVGSVSITSFMRPDATDALGIRLNICVRVLNPLRIMTAYVANTIMSEKRTRRSP